MNIFRNIWKLIFSEQKKPCVNCQHITYGVNSNEPICFINEKVYKRKDITKYTCKYWNVTLDDIFPTLLKNGAK